MLSLHSSFGLFCFLCVSILRHVFFAPKFWQRVAAASSVASDFLGIAFMPGQQLAIHNVIAMILILVAVAGAPNQSVGQQRATAARNLPTRQVQNESRSRGTRDLLPIPSFADRGNVRSVSGEAAIRDAGLPASHGQVWREYDISEYTKRYDPKGKPEQSIVDWILRETGTELWFSQPMGVLNVDRNRVRVYHTPQIQQVVAQVVERYTQKELQQYGFGMQMCTVSNPNWRAMALPKMGPATIQTPGVEAWLLSKENAAIVLAELRKRSDFREHSSPSLVIRNGDTHELSRMRPVAYRRGVGSVPNAQVVSQTKMWQVDQGFVLELSPLIRLDGRHVDAILKIKTNQVENMKQVTVVTPVAENENQRANIQVPQTSSWSLHERFHWPVDQVLLISCGVVATPVADETRGLLNPLGAPRLGLPRLMPRDYRADRADALIFIDTKGRFPNWTANGNCPPCESDSYQGRY